MALSWGDVDFFRVGECFPQGQLLLRRADHVLFRHHHQDRRGRHVFHNAVGLPHDDVVIALEGRSVLMSGRAPALCVDHVIKFLLVGPDAHPCRILAFLGEHGKVGGRVARGLRLSILHALGEHAGELFGRELEVQQRTDGDAAFGAIIQRSGAQGDGGGE